MDEYLKQCIKERVYNRITVYVAFTVFAEDGSLHNTKRDIESFLLDKRKDMPRGTVDASIVGAE